MQTFNYLPHALALAIALTSGCAVNKDKQIVDSYTEQANESTTQQVSRNLSSVTSAAKRAAQDVSRPYIIGKAIPLSREVTLPLPLRKNVNTTLIFSQDADLLTIASRIQDATGVPVKVTQDALMPPEAFTPRLGDSDTADIQITSSPPLIDLSAPVSLDSPLPGSLSTATSGVVTSYAEIPRITKNQAIGQQPLASTLDSIAMRLGVYWKYDEALAAIVIYRTETRTYEIRGAEFTPSSEMSVELRGSINPASTSGMDSKSKSSLKAEESESPMTNMIARVKQFTTRSGRVVAAEGGMLVVTDTKGALDQIDKFIKAENTMRTRRIDMVFEEITIEKSTSSQAGANWNLIFGTTRGDNLNVSGLNSLLEQEGAALSLGGTVGAGPWAGSSVAVQALSKVGKIVSQKVNSFGSNNGQPATMGRPEKQKYIDKLEQTQSSSDTSRPTVSVTQAEEVSGRILTVQPFAYSDGDINIVVKYDNTPTPEFEKQVLPDGSYVQSPKSVSDILVRPATVKSGQPYVIFASTDKSKSSSERRTDRNASMLFGGSDIVDQTERVTVFVLTAMVNEK